MREVNLVVIHCSDSDIQAYDNIETIRKWHIEERGWSDIGYHYFIDKRGSVHRGRDEATVGAHVAGHNARSIGICLSGRKQFTDAQFRALKELLVSICKRYNLDIKTQVKGHRDLQPAKTCPNFEVQDLIKGLPTT